MILLQTQFIPYKRKKDDDTLVKDSMGYLIKNDLYRPEYQLPQLINYSIPRTIISVMNLKYEGLLSIWKGHYPFFLRELTYSITEPIVNRFLTDITLTRRDFPLIHSNNQNTRFTLLVTSHFITGLLLSPLELIQTRMVLQTRKKGLMKYKSTMHCYLTILKEEYDSFFDLYNNKLLFPTAIYHILSPLFRNSTPLVVDKLFGYSNNSIAVVFVEFGISLMELIVLVPLQTIRRRLMGQIIRRKPIDREFTTIIDLDPIPYSSWFDCMIRIMHEGSPEGKWSFRGLYRGFRVRLITNAVVALLQLLTHAVDTIE
jgi:fusion and transport protein UGO1